MDSSTDFLTKISPKTLSEKKLPVHRVHFEAPLNLAGVARLRRTICLYVGESNDLFHNHRSRSTYFYRYPLVQYKTLRRQAAVLGLGEEGCAAVCQLIENEEFRALFDFREGRQFFLAEQQAEPLQLLETPHFRYRIQNYIALNEQNLARWHSENSLIARARLLENCLVGHLLKFASAVRWLLPPHSLAVEVSDFRLSSARVFDNSFLSFEVDFGTNLELPEGIGLGKGVSHGLGVVFLLNIKTACRNCSAGRFTI